MTQAAWVISLALVICRAMMQEVLRPETLPAPGMNPEPAFCGPAMGLTLDLLFCLPALLVLARRLIDGDFPLRLTGSHLAMFLLGAWTAASVLWAGDKFAAAVQAAHWCAALVLIWSTSQLVGEWLRLRTLAAVGFGLLLVLLVQGYYYRFVDLPDLQRDWQAHKAELLRQRGVSEGSREAIQLGKNIASGDVTGFSFSRNTYAALLVLLMTVSAGVLIQRLADSDSPALAIPIVIALAFGLVMLYRFVQSKTAFVTPLLAALLLWLIWARRGWLARHARRAYAGAVALCALAAAAVGGHGLRHGTLFHVSLTFRWLYWVGAARVFVRHWLRGVGWANFGPAYLAARLPRAAEEPVDPHNFLVRAFVELGVIGGVLMLAWMLRLWWELCGASGPPAPAPLPESPARPSAAKLGYASPGAMPTTARAPPFVLALSIGAIALNCAVAIDWSMGGAWITLELVKRAMFLVALVAGLAIVLMRSPQAQDLDDRPASWVLYATLVALGLFLLHNLIDFSMFEPGPMFLFALLTGGALGMRLHERQPRARGRVGALIAFGVAGVGWLVAWGAGVAPVASAEMLAQQADAHVRQGKPEQASRELLEAFRRVPLNADYAYRAEQAALIARSNSLTARQLLDAAIAADPRSVRYVRARAELEIATGDAPAAFADYQRALRLDPYNMELRLEYADQLRAHGSAAAARKQYELTLQQNARLAPDEIKRLSPERVAQLSKLIESLPSH